MNLKKILVLGLTGAILLTGCSDRREAAQQMLENQKMENRHEATTFAMDTVMTFTVIHEDGDEIIIDAEQEIRRLENLLSVTVENSDISKLNAAAGNEAIEMHVDTQVLLQKGKELGEKTGNAFDIAISPELAHASLQKGSIAIDGTSLTIFDLTDTKVTVSLIPHTYKETLLGIKKEEIMASIEAYQKKLPFSEIIPVSAKKKQNTDRLMELVFKYLPYGPMYYDEDTVTDQPERQIAAELIREKALRLLGEEVPHGIAVTIEKMRERNDGSMVDIEATIVCERDSHKGIIIGKEGAMLKRIGTKAREEIERLFEYKVNLKLWVKVKKDWRDSDILMKNYGYRDKKEEN